MARVYQVKAARKPTTCQKCRKEIAVGDPYKWSKPRSGKWASGMKLVRCGTCVFRPSELMTGKMSGVYAATEGYDDDTMNAACPRDLIEAMNAAAEGIREVAEEYQAGSQNIEDGFGHSTSQSDEMREQGENLEGWADEIESAANDLEDMAQEYENLEEAKAEWDEKNDDVGPTVTCTQCSHIQSKGKIWGEECKECGHDSAARFEEGMMEEANGMADEQMSACPV